MDNTKVYGFIMAKISEVYLSTLSKLMENHGLERNFFPLLYLCDNSGEITQQDFAVALRKDKVSTMRTVDYLYKKGMVLRQNDMSDRRCNKLIATDKAFALAPKIKDAVEKTNNLLFADLSEKEKKSFGQSILKIYATLEQLPEPEFIVKAHKRKN